MTLAVWIVYGAMGAIALAFFLAYGLDWIESMVKGDGGHSVRERKFFEDARRRGVPYLEACDELLMMEHLARLRRLASEKVMADPANWLRSLNQAKADAIEGLAHRPELAVRFGESLDGLPYNHILYKRACKAVERATPVPRRRAPNQDQIAALQRARVN